MKWFVLAIATIMIGGAFILKAPDTDFQEFSSGQVLGATSVYESSNNILAEVNAFRLKNGLQSLQFSQEVKILADYRLADMVSNKYYAHKSPKSSMTYVDIIDKYVVNSTVSCENLQLQNNQQINDAVIAWSNSESHRNCLLNPKLTKGALASTYYDEAIDVANNSSPTYVFVFIGSN